MTERQQSDTAAGRESERSRVLTVVALGLLEQRCWRAPHLGSRFVRNIGGQRWFCLVFSGPETGSFVFALHTKLL
jgi:hypothetical protein